VEPGNTRFTGSRELGSYARSAVGYATRLRDFLPEIETWLRETGAGGNESSSTQC